MADIETLELISAGSATSGWERWAGGHGTFSVEGDPDGATLKLQMTFKDSPASTDIIDVGSDVEFANAVGVGNFDLPECFLRANLSGGTSPSVTARVAKRG